MSNVNPEIHEVRLGDVTVDLHVQRNTLQSRVEHIARNFDMEAFGVIVLSQRANGDYYVIDGAHRCGGGVKAEGEDLMVPALVYTGLTIEQEADMFLRLNDTRQIPPLDKFKVRLVAGDVDARTINDLALAHGWTIGQNIMAIGSIEDVFFGRAGGMPRGGVDRVYPEALSDTFACLAEAWGNTQESGNGYLFKGIGAVFLRNPGLDRHRLATRLAAEKDAGGFLGTARTRLAGTHNGLHKAVHEVAAMVWNRRLAADKQIPVTW